MAKVLVVYYSSYGHVETMAYAVAEGARAAAALRDAGAPDAEPIASGDEEANSG